MQSCVFNHLHCPNTAANLLTGTGMQIPAAAANALTVGGVPLPVAAQSAAAPPIATQCFMLSNMFDPLGDNQHGWESETRDDVIEECNKHGGVLHVYVDRASPQGNVYVKCPNINTAVAAVNSLHGRWFAGNTPSPVLVGDKTPVAQNMRAIHKVTRGLGLQNLGESRKSFFLNTF